MMRWIDGMSAAELEVGGVRVVRDGRTQIAVFRREDRSLIAVDNRCPHEGYPLSQGSLNGDTLTCCYHNFKFDVNSGACGKGEPLTIHGVRESDGRIEVGVVQPDPELLLARRWASWEEAMFEEREGQALRDTVRLLDLGVSKEEVAARIARWDTERGPWGPSHAAITAWEALQIAAEGPQAVVALAVPLQLAMRRQVRRERRPVVPAAAVKEGWEAQLLGLVESEQGEIAEAVLRGAIEQGAARSDLEPLFLEMCAAHYLDFGHALIYTLGYFDMLDRVGWDHAPGLLTGLLAGIVNGTREDVLPAWTRTREFFEANPAPSTWRSGDQPFTLDPDLTVSAALRAAQDALEGPASLDALLDSLVDGAAERVLRFDVRIDARSDVQDSWLSVTHCLTFAHAVRVAVGRWDSDAAARLVLQAVRMNAHHRVLDGVAADRTPEQSDVAGVLDAMGNPDTAVRRAAWVYSREPESLLEALRGVVLADSAVQGIFAAHQLKTLEAAFREDRELAVLAAVRLLAAPKRERTTERRAGEALRFVLEGKTPKLLAP